MTQWTDEQWREFEAKLAHPLSESKVVELVKLTTGQEEHPEWYDSPCLCDLCRSYGD